MVWSGLVLLLRLSALSSLHLSLSNRLFSPELHIPPAVGLPHLAYEIPPSPTPPHPPEFSSSLPRGRLERIPRVWLLHGNCGLWRQRRKRSWQDWPEILRAERSSNALSEVGGYSVRVLRFGSSNPSVCWSSHQMPVGGSTGSYSAIHRTWR